MPNCAYCPNPVFHNSRCDSCGKGPLCGEHARRCIMMTPKDQHFDPQYDRDWSIRCVECVATGKPNMGFAPIIGRCFSCNDAVWKVESCSICGNGPYCRKCCNNIEDKPVKCLGCQKNERRSQKWKFVVKHSDKNIIDDWLKSHPGWEEYNREEYMKRAEEKWQYERVCKVMADIQSEKLNSDIFTNKWKK